MRIIVSGSSGLVGSALMLALTKAGHDVVRLVRSPTLANPNAIYWRLPQTHTDPGQLDPAGLKTVDVVVNLGGENIAKGRWNKNAKKLIRESRVFGTRLLCQTVSRLNPLPKAVISASGTGYYGNRGEELLDEEASSGSGFLASVCQEWEASCRTAIGVGIRVVHLRTGVVLSPRGGALAKMLPIFRLGLGGKLGSGSQYLSWVSLSDIVAIIMFLIDNESISGPVNAVAPNPVTNMEFTKTLGRHLSRPTFFRVPKFMLSVVAGEMAHEMLLSSSRVTPHKLEQHGFRFNHPDLESAFEYCLGE